MARQPGSNMTRQTKSNLKRDTLRMFNNWYKLKANTMKVASEGAGVGRRWLINFYGDPELNAGVDFVQALHDWLIKQGET